MTEKYEAVNMNSLKNENPCNSSVLWYKIFQKKHNPYLLSAEKLTTLSSIFKKCFPG